GSASDPQTREQVDLVTELEGRPIQTSPRNVQFRCKVAPKQKLYELTDVPVHFLCPVGFGLRPRFVDDRPAKVSLQLLGPAGDEPPPVLAFVDLTLGNLGRGRNLEPVRVQLPRDFQLMQNSTPLIAFTLDEPDRAAATTQKATEQ